MFVRTTSSQLINLNKIDLLEIKDNRVIARIADKHFTLEITNDVKTNDRFLSIINNLIRLHYLQQ